MKRFFFLFALLPFGICAQLSVGFGVLSHNDYFLAAFRQKASKPYCHYFQSFIVADYGFNRWHASLGVSMLRDSRHLTGDFTYLANNSGPSEELVGHKKSADAAFSYIGFRPGFDYALVERDKFRLLVGVSEHFDVLTEESYANRRQTDADGNPGSGDFTVLVLDSLYCYTNLAVKPSVRFGAFRIEAELLMCFFGEPRVRNKMASPFRGDQQYYASGWSGLLFSNEINLKLAYTFGGRKP